MAEKKLNLYEKLLEIQRFIVSLGKDGTTRTYNYVTGNKLLGYLKPKMNELGIILKTEIISIDNTRQDYIVGFGSSNQREKSEINSKVMMRFTWVDCETGEKDENLFGANGQNDWDKGVGSAITYGERYFLLKYFHIATDEDDVDNPERKPEDNEPNTNTQPQTKDKPRLTESMTAYKSLVGRFEDASKTLVEKKETLKKALDAYEISQVIVGKLEAIINKEAHA